MEFGKVKHAQNIWNEKSPSAIFKINDVVYALCYDEERWYHLEANNKILMQFKCGSYLEAFSKVQKEYATKFELVYLPNAQKWLDMLIVERNDK